VSGWFCNVANSFIIYARDGVFIRRRLRFCCFNMYPFVEHNVSATLCMGWINRLSAMLRFLILTPGLVSVYCLKEE
jgi:hypothetical protein